jgi:glycosyltransferase involved in cell wall biosynthesis
MSENKNILVITQWSFKDPLVQAYTLPYLEIISKKLPSGSKIFLVTFEQDNRKMTALERKQIANNLSEKEIILIDFKYSPFGVISFIKWLGNFIHLFFLVFFRRIKFIHAWATTAGSLGYVLSIATGKPLIIDSYEPHAEAMVENWTWKKESFRFKFLFFLEKKLSRHASFVISATKGMHDYAIKKYGIDLKNFYVKPACVDLKKFNPLYRKDKTLLNELGLTGKIVCVYAGKFGGIYLTSQVFDFFCEAEKFWGDRFRVLLLTSYNESELKDWASQSNFDSSKMIIRFVEHDSIEKYLGLGDFGITPVKSIPTKRYCTPIKDGEYWALGLPVVITKDISDDSEIIMKNNAGSVLNDLSTQSYKKAIEEINRLLAEDPGTLSRRIVNLARQYRNFDIAEKIYGNIYS